jgi:[ribosomal protein S5]-alanine N-acetyltransferase
MAGQGVRNHWPIRLRDNELLLRPLRHRDKKAWDYVRLINREWLSPWEATRPKIEENYPLPSYFEMVRTHQRDGKGIYSISLGIWLLEKQGELLIGQITMGGIVFGAMRGAHIGYWLDQNYVNRGLTTRAVNLLTGFAFNELSLHRIEINLRPENFASKRVAEKCGYTFEGIRPNYLHIDGSWRDHATYVKENPEIR